MALETMTYTLTAGANDTQTLERFGGWDTYAIDVTSATGAFELIFQASADGTEWDDLWNSGTVTDIDAQLINVVPTYLGVRMKVTDISAAGNVIVVDVTPFADSESLTMTSQVDGLTRHTRLFTGDVWYVDAGVAATGDGRTPDNAFLTIDEGITAAAAGDAITVKAGTYDEAGLDLSLAGLELWCEAGAFIVDTTPGTCLTVSGGGCYINGAHFVQAGAVGVAVTGIGNILEDCIAVNCTTGFDIDEHSTQLFNCVSAGSTVTAFDIAERNTILRDCHAPGLGGATRGYYLSNAAVTRSLLDNCTSADNATAGFETVTGTAGNIIKDCSSGAGDGRWVDADHANTWPGFSFDSVLHKVLTLDGSASQNLFQITGDVEVKYIYGAVETALAADVTGAVLELYDSTAAVDITATAAAPAISSLPVGSYLAKTGAAAVIMTVQSSAAGAVVENVGNIFALFTVMQKTAGANTFIRLTRAGAGASGVIDWRIEWRPLSSDGFVAVV